MGILTIIALIVIGILLITVETFLLAGTLVTGITGGVFLVLGLIFAFTSLGTLVGTGVLIATILTTFLIMFSASKYMEDKEFGLQAAIDGKVNEVDVLLIQKGDIGEAFGDLRLNGRARINNEIFDVESTGHYIDTGTEIKVVSVIGSKIMVEAITEQDTISEVKQQLS